MSLPTIIPEIQRRQIAEKLRLFLSDFIYQFDKPQPLRLKSLALWLVLAAAALLAYRLSSEYLISIFMERDLARASDLLRGNFPLWGPETNAGGSLIGPFYYYLLAVGRLLGNSLQSMQAFFSVAQFLGFALIGLVLLRAGLFAALIFLSVFSASYTAQELSMFWNPSLLPLFLGMVLMSMERWASGRSKGWAVAAILVAALSVQVHGTGWFLLAATLFALLREREERAGLVLPVMLGLLLSFSFHLPALITGSGQERDGPMGSVQLLGHLFSRHLPLLEDLWKMNLPLCLLPFGVALFARPDKRDPVLGFLWVLTLISVPGMMMMILLDYGQRYGLLHAMVGQIFLLCLLKKNPLSHRRLAPLLVFFLLEIAVWAVVHKGMMRNFWYFPYLAGIQGAILLCSLIVKNYRGAFLLLYALFSAFAGPLNVGATNLLPEVYEEMGGNRYMRVNLVRRVAKQISEHTCWKPEEARAHIYVHPVLKIDTSTGFHALLTRQPPRACDEKHRMDGVMIAPLGATEATLTQDSQLPDFVKSFFARQVIETKIESFPRNGFTLLFYRFREPGQLFSNIGLGYRELDLWKGEAMAQRRKRLREQAVLQEVTPEGILQFLWNPCGPEISDCDSEVDVRFLDGRLVAELDSFRWSASARWQAPKHAATLIRPRLVVACAGTEHEVLLAETIGNLRIHSRWVPLRGPLPCSPGKVSSIGFRAEKELMIGQGSLFDEFEDRTALPVPDLLHTFDKATRRSFFESR